MKQIYQILPVLCLSIAILFLNTSAYESDEYYCRRNQTDFQVCLRCPDPKKDCPKEPFDEGCFCNNIAVYDGYRDKAYRGGGNCQTEDDYGDFYCYVDNSATCEGTGDYDGMEQSIFASSREHLWYPKDDRGRPNIWYSVEACGNAPEQPETGSELVSGSEQYLKGVEITSDYLKVEGTNKKLEFTFSSHNEDYEQDIDFGWEECQKQCLARNEDKGVCGAWSYDTLNGKCYLHTVDACCGQREKQSKKKPGFISGYVCPHCWSTRNECPCHLALRQTCLTCQWYDHQAADDSANPILTTSSEKLNTTFTSSSKEDVLGHPNDVYRSPWTIDVCACKPFYNRTTNKWACISPCCNEQNGCEDESKCRKCKKKQN